MKKIASEGPMRRWWSGGCCACAGGFRVWGVRAAVLRVRFPCVRVRAMLESGHGGKEAWRVG